MVVILHALLHKATLPQTRPIWHHPLVVLPVVQRRAIPNLPLPPAEQVTNQNRLHAAPVKVTQNLQPVAQVKETKNLKTPPAVPDMVPVECKNLSSRSLNMILFEF